MTKPRKGKSNVIDDPTQTLQAFTLLDLEQYTQEKQWARRCEEGKVHVTCRSP